VAEIVETANAARDLKRMGCDYAQGYFYCEPLAAEDAFQMLRNQERSPGERAAPVEAVVNDDSPTLMIPEESLRMMEDTLMIPRASLTVPEGPELDDHENANDEPRGNAPRRGPGRSR